MEGTTSNEKKKKKKALGKKFQVRKNFYYSKEDSVMIFIKQDAFLPAQGLNYFKIYVLDFASRTSHYFYTTEKSCFDNTAFEVQDAMMSLSARV